jgi:hypothetical protein
MTPSRLERVTAASSIRAGVAHLGDPERPTAGSEVIA